MTDDLEARALEIELHGCTCLPQHSGISEAMILMKGSVRLCQEHEDIARALDAKDVQVAEARRERDDVYEDLTIEADGCAAIREAVHCGSDIPWDQVITKVAALEADLAAVQRHVRTIQDQHRCGQEHVEHEYPCEICNAVHAALASSPGAAR